jgi:hypothetical protein
MIPPELTSALEAGTASVTLNLNIKTFLVFEDGIPSKKENYQGFFPVTTGLSG